MPLWSRCTTHIDRALIINGLKKAPLGTSPWIAIKACLISALHGQECSQTSLWLAMQLRFWRLNICTLKKQSLSPKSRFGFESKGLNLNAHFNELSMQMNSHNVMTSDATPTNQITASDTALLPLLNSWRTEENNTLLIFPHGSRKTRNLRFL